MSLNLSLLLSVAIPYCLACPPVSMTYSTTPVGVSGLTSVARIAASHYATCVIKHDDTLWCWGLNDYGQLGQPPTLDVMTTPMLVPGL